MATGDDAEEKPIYARAGACCYSLPWCNFFLVFTAIGAHTLVYLGNMATANTFRVMGESTNGWSNVGLSTSGSLVTEIEEVMTKVSGVLTNALQQAVDMESEMDLLLGAVGNSTENAIATIQMSRSMTHDLVVQPPTRAISHDGKNTSLLAQDASDVKEMKAKFPSIPTSIPDASNISSIIPDDPMSIPIPNMSSLPSIPSIPNISDLRDELGTVFPNISELKKNVTAEVSELIDNLKARLPAFFDTIKPALLQAGQWVVKMGTKIQGFIEQFSQTIDKVQKIFDQVMSKVGGGASEEVIGHLLYETWNIFDITHTGAVSKDDLQQVTTLYGITALNGDKGDQMIDKYDTNKNGLLEQDEYSDFVEDPSLSDVMSYVIRVFAKKLTTIAGTLKGARKRDEVAQSLGDYLTLMAAKNLTKVGWISDSLMNGSKPIELTIDVLKVLVEMDEAPDKTVDLPVGPIVVTAMLESNATGVQLVLTKMADTDVWTGQGWDPAEQPRVVQKVTGWVTNATEQLDSGEEHAMLLASAFMQEDSRIHSESSHQEILAQLAHVAHSVTRQRVQAYKKRKMQHKIQRHKEIFHAGATRHIYSHLLGHTSMLSSAGTGDEDVDAALKNGIPAVPETLEFAQWLVNNATDCSQRFQTYAFNKSKTSSNQIDSFANQIQSFIKKIQNFLNLMMEYSTERGIDELEGKIQEFVDNAADDLESVVDNIINQVLSGNTTTSLLQLHEAEAVPDLSGTFSTVSSVLTNFKQILPTVIDDLKFAKKEVSAVSSTLESIFGKLQEGAPSTFDEVAVLYEMLWTTYYFAFVSVTVLLLFYALWAAGILNPPSGQEIIIVQETGCCACLKRYCSNCLQCLRDFQDMHLCMWSCIILSEIVILTMFLVSILFLVVAGVKAFIAAGCSQVYLLGDDNTCQSIVTGLRGFLETFWVDQGSPIESACDEGKLTACKIIVSNMLKSSSYTVLGSFIAAIASLQMIFDFAHRHEQAYFMNKLRAPVVYES